MVRFTAYQVISTFLSLRSVPVMILYLVMIWMGKYYQRHTSPLSLRPLLVVHNLSCSLISLYTLFGMIYGMYESNTVFAKESTPTLLHFFFVYFCTKNLELLDTIFMILRHRSRQISFLHVYHHASMLLLSDFSYNYCSWPAIAFGLSINCLVHVFLYLYYAQTAYDSSRAPPWKKNMTQMQILQFLVGLVHNTMGYIYHGFCIYSFFYAFSMLYLFSNFYYHSFIKPPRNRKVQINYNSTPNKGLKLE